MASTVKTGAGMSEPRDEPRYNATITGILDRHGQDPVEVYWSQRPVVLFQLAILAIPVLFAIGSATGAAFSSRKLGLGLGIAAVALAWPSLLALVGAIQLLSGVRRIVVTYADKIVIVDGSSEEVVPWDEIEAVFVRTQDTSEEIYTWEAGKPHTLWVTVKQPIAKFWMEWTEILTRDGRRFHIASTITDYRELSEEIQGETSNRIWQRIQGDYDAEKPLSFGPFAVCKPGLRIGEAKLPWNNHFSTKRLDGWVATLDKDEEPFGPTVATGRVPNLALALYVINRRSEEVNGSDGTYVRPARDDE
jgi:hypothetical protein